MMSCVCLIFRLGILVFSMLWNFGCLEENRFIQRFIWKGLDGFSTYWFRGTKVMN